MVIWVPGKLINPQLNSRDPGKMPTNCDCKAHFSFQLGSNSSSKGCPRQQPTCLQTRNLLLTWPMAIERVLASGVFPWIRDEYGRGLRCLKRWPLTPATGTPLRFRQTYGFMGHGDKPMKSWASFWFPFCEQTKSPL